MSNEQYNRDEPESQVRNIIKQLNDERPSKEKSREVVVRPDGTKVVRVIKKRKVMVSSSEKNRHTRRRLLMLLLAILIICGVMGGIVSVRMSVMAGESFIEERQQELRIAWGADAVQCNGARIEGFSLQVDSLVAEFPENSILDRVELRNLSASLRTSSFFSGMLESDDLKVESAVIRMREGVDKFTMPRQQGPDLWKIRRVSCGKLTFSVGDESTSPLSLKNAKAYMYVPPSGPTNRILIFNEGVLQMKGWKPIVISDAKLQFSTDSIDDIFVRGTLDAEGSAQDTASTSVSISGNIGKGGALAGPFNFASSNINFSELSAGKFMQFFSGVTTPERGASTLSAYITLPLDSAAPEFFGSFRLKQIRVTSLPALNYFVGHLEPMRRRAYLPPTISEGTVELSLQDGARTLRIQDGGAVENELLSLRADVTVDAQNLLSGKVDYGIPSKLTHAEYPDGLADPVFSDDGVYAWLSTTLSGPANAPADNSAELDAQAETVRANRPKRIPFDEIDVDDFSAKVRARNSQINTSSSPSAPAADNNKVNTTETTVRPVTPDNNGMLPTAPQQQEPTPSPGGLSLPTDEEFFPGLYH